MRKPEQSSQIDYRPVIESDSTKISKDQTIQNEMTDNIDDAIISTVILESSTDNQYDNQQRFGILNSVVSNLVPNHIKKGIVVFPGGMFYTNENHPSSLYSQIETVIVPAVKQLQKNIIVCFGIDGSVDSDGFARDQVAVAVDGSGIIALGKKFYPANAEKGHVNLTTGYNVLEDSKPRIFKFGNSSFYLAMCYDSFGIKILDIQNPGVNGIIELAHCFYPKGQGPSGESYFARHGFAGASRQWKCPVYGTAVFFKRSVPEKWPTGVLWNQGTISTTEWNYSMNPLKPLDVMKLKNENGSAVIRLFPL